MSQQVVAATNLLKVLRSPAKHVAVTSQVQIKTESCFEPAFPSQPSKSNKLPYSIYSKELLFLLYNTGTLSL